MKTLTLSFVLLASTFSAHAQERDNVARVALCEHRFERAQDAAMEALRQCQTQACIDQVKDILAQARAGWMSCDHQ